MSVVYIIEQNAAVSKEGNRLVVKKDGAVLHSIQTFKVDQVVVVGNVFLTPSAIKHLLHNEIDTTFMTVHGKYLGRLQPLHSKNILLRRQQFQRADDLTFSLQAAKTIVKGKLMNMRTILMRLNRSRERLDISNQILAIRMMLDKVDSAESLDILLGYEGRGTTLYFEGFSQSILSDDLTFSRRIRRPPTDPVNAMLSLGYTLLFNTVMAMVNMAGFDPYLGFLHAAEYGRPSLPLDLMEEWRSVIIDTLVLSIINLKVLTKDDFTVKTITDKEPAADINEDRSENESSAGNTSEDSNALPVVLTDGGFRKYITQFERKMSQQIQYPLNGQTLTYRDCIKEQVYHFARYIKGEDKEYIPIALK